MSLTQARTDIATVAAAVQTAWSSWALKVEMDNRDSVDYTAQVKPFLQIDTVYMKGEQLDLGANPFVRQQGFIILSAVSKEGSGTVDANALLDFTIPYFERKNFVAVRTEVAEPHPSKTIKGWFYQPVVINFSFVR